MVKAKQRKNVNRLTKIPTTVYLEPEQQARLQDLSATTRVPMQEYLREGVDYVLDAHYKTSMGGAAKKKEAKK